MRYALAIHKDDDSDYGVTVPDVPGCHSAGATLDEAIQNAHEGIAAHLELLAEDGVVAPSPTLIDTHMTNPDYEGAIWAYADIDVSAFLGKTEKVNATIPKLLITKIDDAVSKGKAKSRSAYLAESAAMRLAQ